MSPLDVGTTVGSSHATGDARVRSPLYALQALRFLAAAMVLVHHAGYDADTLASRTGQRPLGLDHVFDWGFGIHLFFVLSGFIMTYAERDFGQAGAPLRFMVRRLVRIVPLYWLMTTALLVGAYIAPSLLNTPVENWAAVAGSYLFIPVLRTTGDSHPVLGQGWTLNYEMMFYVVFAVAMLWPRGWGLAALTMVLISFVVAGSVLHPRSAAPQVWSDPLLFEFLFGIGVAILRDSGTRLTRSLAGSLILVGSLAAIAFGPAFGLGGVAPQWLLQGAPAAAILAGFALGPTWPATPLVVALSGLGDASYSLYLSHPFAIRPLRDVWLRFGSPRAPIVAYLLLTCAVAIAVSLILHRWIERPITQMLRRWTGARLARPSGSRPVWRIDHPPPRRRR